MKYKAIPVLAAGLLALTLAGCGTGTTAAQTGAAATPETSPAAQAAAHCLYLNRKRDMIQEDQPQEIVKILRHFIISINSCSVSIFIPSSSALRSFEPAFSPATT